MPLNVDTFLSSNRMFFSEKSLYNVKYSPCVGLCTAHLAYCPFPNYIHNRALLTEKKIWAGSELGLVNMHAAVCIPLDYRTFGYYKGNALCPINEVALRRAG